VAPIPHSIFVALGDSFTEGLEDEPGPGGHHLGWADRVAASLARREGRVRYANLAVRGRLLDQVVAEQLPLALTMGRIGHTDGTPVLVSFHAGANDVLRPGTDIPALMRRYDAAVGRLVDAGVEVLLFTVIERAGGTGRTAARLAARFGQFNDGAREVAHARGALLADVGAVPALQDRRLWHEDRLHLGPEGHERVAAAVLEKLGVTEPELTGGEAGWWRTPLPVGPRQPRHVAVVTDVRWVRRHLLPWVGRRVRGVSSGDNRSAKHADLVDVVPDSPATLDD
jgi:lysophospholipase L1-like esterase